MKPIKCYALILLILVMTSPLFAASITNEGKTPVKLSGKTKSGILAAMTINPGETLPIRQAVLYVEHIPEGTDHNVNIRIQEDNGSGGSIQTPGGRYSFSGASQTATFGGKPEKKTIPLQAGYALNSSNVQVSMTLVRRDGRTVKQRVMPGQTVNIPEDIVEVKVGTLDSNRGNEEVNLTVMMPDGRTQQIRSSKTSISISPEAR